MLFFILSGFGDPYTHRIKRVYKPKSPTALGWYPSISATRSPFPRAWVRILPQAASCVIRRVVRRIADSLTCLPLAVFFDLTCLFVHIILSAARLAIYRIRGMHQTLLSGFGDPYTHRIKRVYKPKSPTALGWYPSISATRSRFPRAWVRILPQAVSCVIRRVVRRIADSRTKIKSTLFRVLFIFMVAAHRFIQAGAQHQTFASRFYTLQVNLQL